MDTDHDQSQTTDPAAGDAEPAADPPEAHQEPSLSDLQKQLREREKLLAKEAKDRKRLERIAKKYDEKIQAEQEIERQRAEEKGEWRQLYDAEVEAAKAARSEAERAAQELESAHEYLRTQIETGISAIEDESARAQLTAALEGLDPVRAHRLLAAMRATLGGTTGKESAPPPRAGPAGRPKPHQVRRADLQRVGAGSEDLRRAAVLAALKASGE